MGIRRIATSLVLAMGAIGFATNALTPAGASSPTPTTCHASTKTICVDGADGGRTMHAAVGDAIDVILSRSGGRYLVPRELGTKLLSLRRSATTTTGRAIADFVAIAPGRTILQTTMTPICAKGTACPQFILLWRVTFVIAR